MTFPSGRLLACAMLVLAGEAARAQDGPPVLLDPVVVSAQRSKQPEFDSPAAISVRRQTRQ